MNQTLLGVLAGTAIAGAVVAATFALGSGAEQNAERVTALEERMRSAEEENRSLRLRLFSFQKAQRGVSEPVLVGSGETPAARQLAEAVAGLQGVTRQHDDELASLREGLASLPTRTAAPDEGTDRRSGSSVSSGVLAANLPPVRTDEIRTVLAQIEDEKRAKQEEREYVRSQERSRRMVEELEERLGLSQDQLAQFADALFARDQSRGELWRGRGMDGVQEMTREERELQSELVTQGYESTLQQLLTPAQYTELVAVREEGSGRRRRGQRGGND